MEGFRNARGLTLPLRQSYTPLCFTWLFFIWFGSIELHMLNLPQDSPASALAAAASAASAAVVAAAASAASAASAAAVASSVPHDLDSVIWS